MERLALAGLLVVVLPSLALAQRVELGVLAGRFHPLPATDGTGHPYDCSQDPCPFAPYRRVTRSAATTLGGRLTLRLSDRHGIDAVVLSGHVRTAVAGNLRPVGVQDVSVVVITLQPYHTFALNRLVGVNVGAGFVLAVANAPDNPSLGVDGWKHGLAISSALRVSIIPPLSLEISGSASRYLRSAGQMHVAWSAGLAYVFPRGQAQ